MGIKSFFGITDYSEYLDEKIYSRKQHMELWDHMVRRLAEITKIRCRSITEIHRLEQRIIKLESENEK